MVSGGATHDRCACPSPDFEAAIALETSHPPPHRHVHRRHLQHPENPKVQDTLEQNIMEQKQPKLQTWPLKVIKAGRQAER